MVAFPERLLTDTEIHVDTHKHTHEHTRRFRHELTRGERGAQWTIPALVRLFSIKQLIQSHIRLILFDGSKPVIERGIWNVLCAHLKA